MREKSMGSLEVGRIESTDGEQARNAAITIAELADYDKEATSEVLARLGITRKTWT